MTTTWTQTGNRSVKAVCTSGSEALTQPTQASTTVAFVSAVAGNSVSIRGYTFTAIANGATPERYQFAVGAGGSADSDTGDAFVAALAAAPEVGVSGVNSSGTVTVSAVAYGAGHNYAVTKVGDPITVGHSTLQGGIAIVGVSLRDVGSVSVKAECATKTSTITGGTLDCYILNERTMKYIRYPDGDLSVGAAKLGYAWAMTVTVPDSVIQWIPTGVTISAGNLEIYLDAYEADTRPTAGRAL